MLQVKELQAEVEWVSRGRERGYRLCQVYSSTEVHFSGLCMLTQVKASSVRTANALHPALKHAHTYKLTRPAHTRTHTHVGGPAFSIPAVSGIMSHLIAHVLTKPQLVWSHAHTDQELVDSAQEIGQCLVSNNTLTTASCYGYRAEDSLALTVCTASPRVSCRGDFPSIWSHAE